MNILSRDIHDQRLLNLLRQGLEAGKVDEWGYKKTYSGTPQGGILSPLLSNIYLNELDVFVETQLKSHSITMVDRERRKNPAYRAYETSSAKRQGKLEIQNGSNNLS